MLKRTTTTKTQTTQPTEAELNEYDIRMATNAGLELIKQHADSFRRAAAEMDRYAAQYEALPSDSDDVSHAAVLSYFVNTLFNAIRNCNVDTIVLTSARIAAARAKGSK
jgi:hypothetical protein